MIREPPVLVASLQLYAMIKPTNICSHMPLFCLPYLEHPH